MHRRSTALLAGMAAFALVAASAATLGGLEVDGGLGADSAEVTACTVGGITASFTTGAYDLTEDIFPVDTVELFETDLSSSCAGTQVTVVLLDQDPIAGAPTAVLAEVTGNFDDFKSTGVTVPAGVSAEAVNGLAVSIVG